MERGVVVLLARFWNKEESRIGKILQRGVKIFSLSLPPSWHVWSLMAA